MCASMFNLLSLRRIIAWRVQRLIGIYIISFFWISVSAGSRNARITVSLCYFLMGGLWRLVTWLYSVLTCGDEECRETSSERVPFNGFGLGPRL
jgi:hypothetical protein